MKNIYLHLIILLNLLQRLELFYLISIINKTFKYLFMSNNTPSFIAKARTFLTDTVSNINQYPSNGKNEILYKSPAYK